MRFRNGTVCMLACAFIGTLTARAGAQVADGTPLDLAGFTPELDLDGSNSFKMVSGELGWWGAAQLPPQPFSSLIPPVSLGLPPNAAWPANRIGLQNQVTGFGNPYYSGYTNEAEAYPNADETLNIEMGTTLQSPVSLSGGEISLIASPIASLENERLPAQLAGRRYISGAFNTYPYSQQYGYFELDGRIPPGTGLWPAFWMVPENMNGPSGDTEIDVMEIVGGQTKVLNSTLHTTDRSSPSYPSLTKSFTAPEDLSQGIHRYGVDWEPDWTTFYLDGVSFYSTRTPADMKQPMYIIANLAVGTATAWGGAPDASTAFPARFTIDSVRSWASPE